MSSDDKAVQEAKQGFITTAKAWGKNPLPPTLLATLITALHVRPFQTLPMLFPPVLLFSTYLNLSGYKTDSAGLTAAWSGLYLLLARRRRNIGAGGIRGRIGSRFGARGLTRGAAMVLAGVNVVGGGVGYAFGNRKEELGEKAI